MCSDHRRLRADLTAAFPIRMGEAFNAAFIPARALGVCIRLSIASNSPLRVSTPLHAPRASAPYSSIESSTALGVSCLVTIAIPLRRTLSRTSPNLFLARVALISTGASPPRLRIEATGLFLTRWRCIPNEDLPNFMIMAVLAILYKIGNLKWKSDRA